MLREKDLGIFMDQHATEKMNVWARCQKNTRKEGMHQPACT